MKSITFFRKTWKKWAAYHRDDELQVNGPRCELQECTSPFSMSILPKSCHSPSQNCNNRPILRRNTSRFSLDIACRAQLEGSPSAIQYPIRDHGQLPRLSSQPQYSSTDTINHSQKLIPSRTLSPKGVEISVPCQKSLPVYQVLQPPDVSDDLGSTYPYNSTNHARSTDTTSSTTSDEVQYSEKMCHTVSDLLADAKPHTLYRGTRSMPYLPHEVQATQSPSVSSVNAIEDNFPLSLFPPPPSLITRKRIPPPLVLCNSPPTASPQSSCDSTPVGTPTTPRFLSPRSASQSSFGSCKRSHLGRRVVSISPPPFSPPDSPLPSPPVYCEDNGRSLNYAGRPLRTAYSSSNLKNTPPFPATHRLTSSESISDQSRSPIKKLRKPRPGGMQPERLQACSEVREQVCLTAVENDIQWGYAL